MANSFILSKKKYILLIILVIAVISGVVYLFTGGQSITGFRFQGPNSDQKMITITADRMVSEGGFPLFGSSPEVRLENGYIDLYAFQADASTKELKFGDLFSAETLASFPVKNVNTISAKPINIRIHDDKSTPTQLFAASATFRIKERDILLSGDVRVLSEPYLLTTDQLSVSPEKGTFRIDKHYVLRTSDKRFEGNQLVTDMLLRPIEPEKK